MTDDMDSDLTNGTPSIPTGGSSEGKGDSGSSFDAKALQASFEALTKRLDEVDARSKSLQGDKDRGIKKANDELNELKRKFAEIEKLKKSGLDEDTAFEELGFREEVRAVREGLSKLNPAQPQPAGNGAGVVVDSAEVIKKYDLEGNDPEVIEKIFRGNFKSPEEMELAALRIAYQRAKPNQPSLSATPPLTGTPPQPGGERELIAAFEKENASIPRGQAYTYQRSQVKAKYRELARKQGLYLNI